MRGQEMLVIIVERHLGREVVKEARAAGAQGATVIHGRGTGDIDIEAAFDVKYEPEKDLVLMVVAEAASQKIAGHLAAVFDFSEPDTGIVFRLPVLQTSGVYQP